MRGKRYLVRGERYEVGGKPENRHRGSGGSRFETEGVLVGGMGAAHDDSAG